MAIDDHLWPNSQTEARMTERAWNVLTHNLYIRFRPAGPCRVFQTLIKGSQLSAFCPYIGYNSALLTWIQIWRQQSFSDRVKMNKSRRSGLYALLGNWSLSNVWWFYGLKKTQNSKLDRGMINLYSYSLKIYCVETKCGMRQIITIVLHVSHGFAKGLLDKKKNSLLTKYHGIAQKSSHIFMKIGIFLK